ncbi:GspH/FimT family pseudopilin [Stenotrophomonas sp. 169]|uniref:GspH/FimT family pseudopilin n=1 Tax=unclassified Stenotrophomonas TaxID=196198 RepID=UPI0016622ECB|nr:MULTISPECIES: Tfp pilus assembly protein FimT/FimU [unclassified Stenotrophomonas]MBD8635129.1 GspH/FimT family pseudopilin [Stenotrophomonas sp. CFBP 13725]MBD8695120.1 GspH/FimT family pseudopilin [Stenotrophomonas sp. CFBP 13718]QNR96258.1 GspH/FimT family pseudopilin [Stenotrophomonas sp. 169]
MSLRRIKGFTLLELMVTISVMAIMAAIAFPSFQSTLRSNRMATTANELIASMALARSEAVKNTRGAGICASTAGASCNGTSWAGGWMVWGDTNRNGSFDAGEPILRFSEGRPTLTGVSDQDLSFSFDGRGRSRANAAKDITLRPQECAGQPVQRRLTISATGQVRLHKEACA